MQIMQQGELPFLDRAAATIVPGQREAGRLTRFGIAVGDMPTIDGPSTMDAATTADRQREGGGAPSERRSGAMGGLARLGEER